eukprot:SAG22_NODE_7998_length_692_cov_1.362563_1_plen_37_part_10
MKSKEERCPSEKGKTVGCCLTNELGVGDQRQVRGHLL